MEDHLLRESVWYLEKHRVGNHRDYPLEPVLALIHHIEQRDPGLVMHSHRVTGLSMRLARGLGLPDDQVQIIRLAGLLHDVGKLQIPDTILNKQAPLNEEEWAVVYRHPIIGADMVQQALNAPDIAELIMTHHERYDGHGYPCGLVGKTIPLGARILAVADSYCAMTDERAYRGSLSPRAAYEEVLRCTATDFDPQVVDVFIRISSYIL